uniref:Fibronectin type-III domain-containing protein n=1 Tax=Chelydra serpentina TaxID=8475 RepID=A0A8C3T3S6_CHESE
MQCTETAGRVKWDTSHVSCVEKCPRPQWDPTLRFVPDWPFYGQNEETTLSCPGESQPSLSVIRCVRWGQTRSHWNAWAVSDRGTWRRITDNGICVVIPRITPGAPEISPTTIKLRWTCEPPESCQGSWKIRAQCRLDGPWSDACRRQGHTTREQPLQGRDRTVTCSSLHPFTSYNVTISGGYPATRPPSTVLYTRRVRTSETAPDRPEIEPLDPSTKTFRWKQLPACKGAIVGYQLNITARRENDSDFLEVEELRVSQSVTEYRLHPWRHGTNYTVTIQGLTAAGLGQASRWDFETIISGTCRREGAWTTNVTFLSEQTTFRVNDTVLVTCPEDPESGPFPANCTELKDRGAVWDISGVKCLRMCNDWLRQVDFDPAQTEFGVGAEGRVTCRQQFQPSSFSVTCRETESGHFEWDSGKHKCVSECGEPALGLAGHRLAGEGSSQAAERPWGESCCNEQLPTHGVPGGAGAWI